jgi:hypothetical protein
MRNNTSKNAYPRRNGTQVQKPKYGGKALWGMQDTRIKCMDCIRYASHEAIINHEPNPFNPATEATVHYCIVHANKAVARNVIVSVKPFAEYSAYTRALTKWQDAQGGELQEVLL